MTIKHFFCRHDWRRSFFQLQALNTPSGEADLTLICEKCGKVKVRRIRSGAWDKVDDLFKPQGKS